MGSTATLLYRWLVPLASGRRVVVLGAGDGAGPRLFAATGARSVRATVETGARLPTFDEDVELVLQAGDGSLPLEDGSSDLAICLELPDGDEERARAIEQASRLVARDDGLLVVSWPASATTSSEGIQRALRPGFPQIRELAVAAHPTLLVSEPPAAPSPPRLAARPSRTLLVAARGTLPELETSGLVDDSIDLDGVERRAAEARRRAAETEGLLSRTLVRAEAAEAERDALRARLELAEAERAQATTALAGVTGSASWRLTSPLRAAKRRGGTKTDAPALEGHVASGGRLDKALVAELDAETAWMYPWQLGGRTARVQHPVLPSIHGGRARMIEADVRAALERGGDGSRALDIACNEGWFSHRLLDWGAGSVLGVDARDLNVRRAELVRDHHGIAPERLSFRCQDALTLDPQEVGTFDVVLLLGLLYHLEDPVGAVRVARSLCRGICVIESQVTRQEEPLEWIGLGGSVEPVAASFAAYPEHDHETNPLASVEGRLSLVPNRAALLEMCRAAGFGDAAFVAPRPDSPAWYRSGDRAILIAW